MIQGQGMGLKGGVPIGLGEVPRIPGLSGEAQVGKPQVLGHRSLLPEQMQAGLHHEMRLEKNSHQEQHAAPDKEPKAIGFSHGLLSRQVEDARPDEIMAGW
jgi:hypothetical protein